MGQMKEIIKKGLYYIVSPMPDKMVLKWAFPMQTGEKFDLENPKTYNQKLQWYKLYYRDPLMVKCADKYEVRDYVESKGYGNLLTPLHGSYDHAEEIDFSKFPEKYVLKTNNAMGTNIFVTDKSDINEEAIRKQLNKWLKKTPLQVWFGREWAYKDIKPKIICEEFIDSKGVELIDYKFHCFQGKPEIVQVSLDKDTDHRINFYDNKWNYIDCKHIYPTKGDVVEKPPMFDEMIKIAGDLSRDFPHARVDFYNIEEKIIFGELTFYTSAGFGDFDPNDLNEYMGEVFKLPNKR